ncbi:MAG: substrate-binding domain-containing protein, partial [Actinomycetota bacterium]
MISKRGSVVAALAVVLPLAACGGDDSSSEGTESPVASEADGATGSGLGGSIFVSGSSTVEPITTAVAKLFGEANPDVAIQVEGPGTGDGFAKFCAGET